MNDLEHAPYWSHEEKYILQECVNLMHGVVEEIRAALYMQGIQPPEGEAIMFTMNYMKIVNRLFLSHTTHSGGTSTCNKCEELGVDPFEEIEFGFEYDPGYDPWC